MSKLISEYAAQVTAFLQKIAKEEEENILKAAEILSDTVMAGKRINIYGASGYAASATMKFFWRAGDITATIFPAVKNTTSIVIASITTILSGKEKQL